MTTKQSELEKLRKERDAFASALNTANEAVFQKVKEFSVIKRIGASINSSLDPEVVCCEIVDLIIDETIVENCSLWLVDAERRHLEMAAVRGQENEQPRFIGVEARAGHSMPLGTGAAGHAAQTGHPLLINNTAESSYFTKRGSTEVSSLLCMPIKAEGQVFGVLNMSHPDPDAFTDEDQRLLELIGEQVAVSFKNLELVEETRRLNRDLEEKVNERTEHLARSEERYHRAIVGGAVGIWDWRIGARTIYVADILAEMLGYRPNEINNTINFWMRRFHPGDRKSLIQGLRYCFKGKLDVYEGELRMRHRDGRYRWFSVRGSVVLDKTGKPTRIAGSNSNITPRKNAELEVAVLQKEALVNAHAAGKAEFATTVLHNIGNVLNSVNVDSLEIRRSSRAMRLERLSLAFKMIEEHQDDLADFFNSEKGVQLRTYLHKITEVIGREAGNLVTHTEEIQNKIEIARDIIETQQAYAKGNEHKKQDLVQLLDEALKIQHESIRKRGIVLQKKYATIKTLRLPSAKIIHLFINLIKNAVESLALTPPGNRVLSVELGEVDREHIFVRVEDNGLGIAKKNLGKMFSHGFTTKEDGHGFGLRYCAKTAKDLGGSVAVTSDGEGCGATFTVTLPYEQAVEEEPRFAPEHSEAEIPELLARHFDTYDGVKD